jgi:hypothetical protein
MQTHTTAARGPFDPVIMRATREAFAGAIDAVARRLGPDARLSDELLTKLSNQIVGLAYEGEMDAARLRDRALTALHFA